MTSWHVVRFLLWGFISCAALGACSPLRGSKQDGDQGEIRGARAGAQAAGNPGSRATRDGEAGVGSPAKDSDETKGDSARDAAADDGPSPNSDAGPEQAEAGGGAGGKSAAAGRAAAGSGGATHVPAAGGGGAGGAQATAPRAGSSSSSLASLPDPAPLKRPTVCPALGEVQLNWRNAMIPLPGSNAEFLHLLGDGECPGSPRASAVSAKLQLVNRTNAIQTAECWLSSTKSSDYLQLQLAPRATGSVFLQIANPAGGNEHSNVSTVMCRNAGPASGELAATWIKLATEALGETEIREVP